MNTDAHGWESGYSGAVVKRSDTTGAPAPRPGPQPWGLPPQPPDREPARKILTVILKNRNPVSEDNLGCRTAVMMH